MKFYRAFPHGCVPEPSHPINNPLAIYHTNAQDALRSSQFAWSSNSMALYNGRGTSKLPWFIRSSRGHCNPQNPSHISLTYSYFFVYPIIVKFCTKHGSIAAMLCAKFQNDWIIDTEAADIPDITRFKFMMNLEMTFPVETARWLYNGETSATINGRLTAFVPLVPCERWMNPLSFMRNVNQNFTWSLLPI